MSDNFCLGRLACAAAVTLLGGLASAQPIPAFSGAEGPGATATGGRGGDVYHVTNLEFDLAGAIPGSLNYGLKSAPASGRTIVFDVGGTIFENGGGPGHWLRSSASNVTIAGQTAPGPGVTIAGVGTKWTGDNNIIRNLTVRPTADPANPGGYTYDGFSLQLKNSIVDHVSTSWYTDEGVSITDAGASTTVQYATIAEGLAYDGHAFGSIIATETDGTHYSFNHNFYAHNISRLPAIGSETGQTGAVLSFTNNVIYNWQQTKAGYSATDQHSSSNWLANYYITGYNRGNLTFSGGDDESSQGFTQIYLDKTDPVLANKSDSNRDGDLADGVAFSPGDRLPNGQSYYSGDFTVVGSAFAVDGAVTPDPADVALYRVLDYSGANWSSRSPVEQRILDSTRDGSGRIISGVDSGPQASEYATMMAQRPVAGVASYSRAGDWDTDRDGMPDGWEREHGLDPLQANNNADFDADGYTDLEEYLNELSAWPAPAPIRFTGGGSRFAEILNWRVDTPAVVAPGAQGAFSEFHWQPSRFDEAIIDNGVVVVDAVGQHAGRITLGANPGDDATLNIVSGWLRVESASHGLGDGVVQIGEDAGATATLNLSGGRLTADALERGASGAFSFTGGVLTAGRIGFDLVNQGGTLAPGEPIGTTEVDGDLTLQTGVLAIDLDSQGEADSLMVGGQLTLGGDLYVSLADGVAPEASEWVIATAASITGSFASVTPGFSVETLGSQLVLLRSPPLPGDFNADGVVDAADYTVWRDHQGQPHSLAGNGDDTGASAGVVDAADYLVWQTNYGTTAGAADAGRDAAPEPAALALLLLLAPAGAARRRGQTHDALS